MLVAVAVDKRAAYKAIDAVKVRTFFTSVSMTEANYENFG
jgi:hypothetical protein